MISSLARTAVVTAFVTILLTGCPRSAKESQSREPTPVAIAPGESVLASVLVDGQWHPTGYLVHAGDRIGFEPVGEAKGATPGAIQVHIGRTMTQLVGGRAPQRVSRSGEIVFRVDPAQMGPFEGATVDIRIRRYSEE
ncbi:hypothetical protein JW916_07105 [Candidatus Sumerlaeota bacterium]|nr:hypothetical protein [Candidatus Sumerlaeota bacterium]